MKALRKDFYMEIRKSFSRFISIFLIVALGVAFYAGVRSAEPDMRLSADKLYDQTNLLDIRILSTIGIDQTEVDKIQNIDSVKYAEGVYHYNFLNYYEEKTNVVTVMSINDNVCKLTLVDGKMPSNDKECLVDLKYLKGKNMNIGDKVTIASGDENSVTDTLKYEQYTISGTFTYSYYMGVDRGTATIGNGKVDGLVALNKECFLSEQYSEMYVLLNGTAKLESYSEEYDDKVEECTEKIEKVFKEAADKRYEDLSTMAAYQGITLDKLDTYVLNRNSIQTYVEYDQDSQRIGNIGKVVPMVFFLVAAFVSLTTMTRMVEEQRNQIGTLKALGYSKFKISLKYILYALLATLSGGMIGGYIGSKILPKIIMQAYEIMYTLGEMVTPINAGYFVSAVLLAVICVLGATIFSIYSSLASSPAMLMRPAAPKKGKRVLLEKIGFIWKHLNFSKKSTIRNLFRYKKRLFMTLFGIVGCMALLLVGFGLKDSINSVVNVQYSELRKYDMVLSVKSENSSQENSDNTSNDNNGEIIKKADDVGTIVKKTNGIQDCLRVQETSVQFTNGDKSYTGYLNVFEESSDLSEFMVFRNRNTKKEFELSDEGVIIAEKTANKLGVKEGDTLTVKLSDVESYQVKVEKICENYVYHNIFMTEKYYKKIFGEPSYNSVYVKLTEEKKDNEEAIVTDLLKNSNITGVTYISKLKEKFNDMLGSLDIITVVLVVSAGGLAFIVLYNLNNINITERIRELATLKVLGFYDGEVCAYIYRENIFITLAGIILGMFFGSVLHKFVIETAEVDMVMFGRDISAVSFMEAALLTVLFAVIINGTMYFKLRKIDMAASLKSVE